MTDVLETLEDIIKEIKTLQDQDEDESKINYSSKEYQHAYYLKNIEKFKEKREEYRKENGDYFKTYYELNKEQMKKSNKEHYLAKQEDYKLKRKAYYQNNKKKERVRKLEASLEVPLETTA